MKSTYPPVAIRLEFVGFDEPAPRGLSGTERAARSLLRRRLAGAKRVEAALNPEAAAALISLGQRIGCTYSAILEGLLLAARELEEPRVGDMFTKPGIEPGTK